MLFERKAMSYLAHEKKMCHLEKKNRGLWLLAMALFAAFVVTNGVHVIHMLGMA